MIVVDASAVVAAFVDRSQAGRDARELMSGQTRHAPHLLDAEVGNVLRRMALRGDMSKTAANRARQLALRSVHHRHDHVRLGDIAWARLDRVTFYDGLYVALASALGCNLVTADLRLARAIGGNTPRPNQTVVSVSVT